MRTGRYQRTVARPNLAPNNGVMSITTTCPYCNSVVPLSEEQVASGQRVACPRCGEAVPVAAMNGHYAAPNVTTTVAPSSANRRQRNRLLGLGLLIGMLA